MNKTHNRKKALKKQQRAAKRQASLAQPRPSQALEDVPEVIVAVEKTALSLEDFLALPALATLPVDRLTTFYEAGIQSLAAFASWSEKDLLGLKGIGPATIKKLREQGIALAS